jgi:hypothetical protein
MSSRLFLRGDAIRLAAGGGFCVSGAPADAGRCTWAEADAMDDFWRLYLTHPAGVPPAFVADRTGS